MEKEGENLDAFIRNFAATQKRSIDELLRIPPTLDSLYEAIKRAETLPDSKALESYKCTALMALEGLEKCFGVYNMYREKWLPAVDLINKYLGSAGKEVENDSKAATLIQLVGGMQTIIKSIMVFGEKYKIIAEEAKSEYERLAGSGIDESESVEIGECCKDEAVGDSPQEPTETDKDTTDKDIEGKDRSDNIANLDTAPVSRELMSRQSATRRISSAPPCRVDEHHPHNYPCDEPRPEERAQLRRGNTDVEEFAEEREESSEQSDGTILRGDLQITCARLATANEKAGYLSHMTRETKIALRLKSDIKLARAHSDDLERELGALLGL